MGESLPKFNSEPVKLEEEELGFKVEDKRRIDVNKIDEEIKHEKEKKKFDAMTSEQREEWEYNRDKERGFTVKDKRFQGQPVDIKKHKENKEKELKVLDQKKIDEVRESINALGTDKITITETEEPAGREPEIYGWKTRLDAFANELKSIENDFRSAKLGARTTLGYGFVSNELKKFQKKFDEYAERELIQTTVQTKRDVLVDEFAKISQKITDIKSEVENYGISRSRNPFKRLGKLFRR